MTVFAIVVAAGRGVRMGVGRPKAYLRLGGRTLLERSVQAFLSHSGVDKVVAAVPNLEEASTHLGAAAGRVSLVRGGETRQDSVRAALEALPPREDEIILVHDAARPLVSRAIIDAVIASASEREAAIPVLTPNDTVKLLGEEGGIQETAPRDRVRLAQTPQGFHGSVLREAYARAARDGFQGTDDASLVERMGRRVWPVEGSQENLKITTPADLTLAARILEGVKSEDESA